MKTFHIPHIRYLKSRGFKVSYVPSGIRNKEVAELAKKTGAVLVTRDWDFSNVMLYPPEKYNGIIILKNILLSEKIL